MANSKPDVGQRAIIVFGALLMLIFISNVNQTLMIDKKVRTLDELKSNSGLTFTIENLSPSNGTGSFQIYKYKPRWFMIYKDKRARVLYYKNGWLKRVDSSLDAEHNLDREYLAETYLPSSAEDKELDPEFEAQMDADAVDDALDADYYNSQADEIR